MNTAVMNLECWLSTFAAWLRKPAQARPKAKPAAEEKARVRIAGLR